LPVSYTSSDTAVATVSGNTVTFVSAAISGSTATITASQGGDSVFRAAIDVVQSLTVVDDVTDTDGDGVPDAFDNYPNSYQVAQTITFGAIADQMLSAGTLTLSATSSSGLPVSYASSNTAIATVSGNTVTLVSALVEGSTITITASQAGDESWFPATSIPQSVTIFDNVTDTDGDGIPDYSDPYPNQQAQAITFGVISDQMLSAGTLTLSATSSSGLPVSYASSAANIATVNGNVVTFVSALVSGSAITITASQAGSNDYLPATSIDRSLTIFDNVTDSDGDGIPDYSDPYPNQLAQAITFGVISDQMLSAGTLTLSATSSSGLPVSYASSDTNIAMVNGNVVTFVSALVSGSAITITASQAGSNDYLPATSIDRSLTIFDNVTDSDGDGIPDYSDPYPNSQSQTITFGSIAARAVIDGNLTLTASATSGLPITFSTPDTSLLTINGNIVSFVGTGSVFTQQVTIIASQSGGVDGNGVDWKAANNVQQAFNLSDLDSDGDGIVDSQDSNPNTQSQTITFAPIPIQMLSDETLTLSATSSSGLPVSYASSNTNIATVNGNVVTFVSVLVSGSTATITASQAGDGDYFAATSIDRSITIFDNETDSDGDGTPDYYDTYPNSQAQTITFGSIADRGVIDGNLTLNATASSGLPITYSTSSSLLTINGNTVSFLGDGSIFTQSVTIVASQSGGLDGGGTHWKAANNVQQAFNLSDLDSDGDGIPDSQDPNPNSQPQTITFGAIPDQNRSSNTYTLTATTTSPLTITYLSSDSAIATVSGSTVTFVGNGGAVTITATQAGDDDWLGAVSVAQSLTIIDDVTDTDQDGIPDISDPWPNQQAHTVVFAGDQNPVYHPGAIGTIQDLTMPGGNGIWTQGLASSLATLNSNGYIDLWATSDAPWGQRPSITWVSSDTAVASFDDGAVEIYESNKLYIHGPGTITITAQCPGNQWYLPFADQTLSFTINPSPCANFSAFINSQIDNTEWLYAYSLADDEDGNFQIFAPGQPGANGSIQPGHNGGGTAPYTYTWTLADGTVLPPTSALNLGNSTVPGAGIPAGSYSVTVTDGVGCTSIASTTIAENSINLCPLNRMTISHAVDHTTGGQSNGRIVTQITGHELSSNSGLPTPGPFNVKVTNVTNLPTNPTATDLYNAVVPVGGSYYNASFTEVVPGLPAGDYLYEVTEYLHSPACIHAEIVTIN
jgi:hypothetical protein